MPQQARAFVVGESVLGAGSLFAKHDPYRVHNFMVQAEGMLVGGCSEVSGLGGTVETETYREGGVNGFVHHFPRQTVHSNIVLTTGMSTSRMLWQWYDDVASGLIRRRDVVILLLDDAGVPTVWWNLRGAYPVQWRGPLLDAGDGGLAFESIELVHEGVSRPLVAAVQTAAALRRER